MSFACCKDNCVIRISKNAQNWTIFYQCFEWLQCIMRVLSVAEAFSQYHIRLDQESAPHKEQLAVSRLPSRCQRPHSHWREIIITPAETNRTECVFARPCNDMSSCSWWRELLLFLSCLAAGQRRCGCSPVGLMGFDSPFPAVGLWHQCRADGWWLTTVLTAESLG